MKHLLIIFSLFTSIALTQSYVQHINQEIAIISVYYSIALVFLICRFILRRITNNYGEESKLTIRINTGYGVIVGNEIVNFLFIIIINLDNIDSMEFLLSRGVHILFIFLFYKLFRRESKPLLPILLVSIGYSVLLLLPILAAFSFYSAIQIPLLEDFLVMSNIKYWTLLVGYFISSGLFAIIELKSLRKASTTPTDKEFNDSMRVGINEYKEIQEEEQNINIEDENIDYEYKELKKLKHYLDEGLINQDEYDAKKRKLLGL